MFCYSSNVSCLSKYTCPTKRKLYLYITKPYCLKPTCASDLSSVTNHLFSAFYGLHINCGGNEIITSNGIKYDADTWDTPGYYNSGNGWVSSNTGNFLDDDRSNNGENLWENSSALNITNSSLDSRFYTHARLSAISLTYYALCLGEGNYTVNLHFAEIMFSNNNSYNSLGRRFFDIYIQVI